MSEQLALTLAQLQAAALVFPHGVHPHRAASLGRVQGLPTAVEVRLLEPEGPAQLVWRVLEDGTVWHSHDAGVTFFTAYGTRV